MKRELTLIHTIALLQTLNLIRKSNPSKTSIQTMVKFLLQLAFAPEEYMYSDQDYELQSIELIRMVLKPEGDLQSSGGCTLCLILTTYGT